MFFQKINAFLLCLIVLFAIGCNRMPDELLDGTDPNADVDDPVSVTPDEIPPDDTKLVGEVVILADTDNAADGWAADPYHFNSATITDDTLTIEVSYGGGCPDEPHQFTLLAEPAFMESDPVGLGISIVHNAHNDPCERWVEEKYHFDLTPIKTMYQQAYQQEAGTIVLRLGVSLDIVTFPEGVLEELVNDLVYEFAE